MFFLAITLFFVASNQASISLGPFTYSEGTYKFNHSSCLLDTKIQGAAETKYLCPPGQVCAAFVKGEKDNDAVFCTSSPCSCNRMSVAEAATKISGGMMPIVKSGLDATIPKREGGESIKDRVEKENIKPVAEALKGEMNDTLQDEKNSTAKSSGFSTDSTLALKSVFLMFLISQLI